MTTETKAEEWEERFVEKGAELEHVRWAKWQNYLHSFLTWNNDLQAWVLPHEKKEHWQRQIETYYGNLSESEKESDRKEVRTYLPVISSLLQQQKKALIQELLDEAPEEGIKWMQEGNHKDRKGYIDGYNQANTLWKEKLQNKLK